MNNEFESDQDIDVEAINAEYERFTEIIDCLSPINGDAKKLMYVILRTVPTDKFQEVYDIFIERVLIETTVV